MKILWCILTAASTVAAQPYFLNADYDLRPGESFTLAFGGCGDGCTIQLMTGESDDLTIVKLLTMSAESSFTFTMDESLPSAIYFFRLIENASKEENYSPQFEYKASEFDGTTTSLGSPRTSSSTASRTSSTTDSAPSSTDAKTGSTDETVSSTAGSNDVAEISIFSDDVTSSTNSPEAQATKRPDGGESDGLGAGAVAGIVVGGVSAVVLLFFALWLCWRNRWAERAHSQIAELEVIEKDELPATSPESSHETTTQSNQSQTPEVHPLEQGNHDLSLENIQHESDSRGQPPHDTQALPLVDWPLTQREPSLERVRSLILIPSSGLEKKMTDKADTQSEQQTSTSGTDFGSLDPGPSNKTLLIDQYAKLEARRQRLIDLDKIEREQEELKQRMDEVVTGKGGRV